MFRASAAASSTVSRSSRRRELQTRIDLYQWLAGAIGGDIDPSERTNNSRLIELLVALDFSDRGSRCGPMYFGRYQSVTSISQIQDYKDWFARASLPADIT